MSAEYAPGTVAIATVRGVSGVRVMRSGTDGTWYAPSLHPRDLAYDRDSVTDVRPLVVLDRDKSFFWWKQLVDDLRNMGYREVADQIEAQRKPQKQPEPTGLGAVVEDSKGRRWTRSERSSRAPWDRAGSADGGYLWDRIDAVKVLSEGVTA